MRRTLVVVLESALESSTTTVSLKSNGLKLLITMRIRSRPLLPGKRRRLLDVQQIKRRSCEWSTTSATHRRRAELGLPDLAEVDVSELEVLLEGHEDSKSEDECGDDRKEKS